MENPFRVSRDFKPDPTWDRERLEYEYSCSQTFSNEKYADLWDLQQEYKAQSKMFYKLLKELTKLDPENSLIEEAWKL